jgi:8-oxo-dGTP diphosphatase
MIYKMTKDIVVSVILINDKGYFLMHLRDNKPKIVYPNHWSFLGGHVEMNEFPEQALRREIKEEIGYDLEKVIYLDRFDDLHKSIVYMYKSRINKRLDDLTLTEGQKLNYFSFDEIFKLKIPEPLRDFLIKNEHKIHGTNQ